ncbi:hypothetical protein V8G54_021179 [Vigna mungo]|uniref:Uncharacterized protein n=1 Tax=Vigna mungo TaxID=3915 RepID=A0AAQ3RWM4_VIGMU
MSIWFIVFVLPHCAQGRNIKNHTVRYILMLVAKVIITVSYLKLNFVCNRFGQWNMSYLIRRSWVKEKVDFLEFFIGYILKLVKEKFKKVFDGHLNDKVKDNFQRQSLVGSIVYHDSIVQLEKMVEKLQMFLTQKRQ